MKRFITLVLMMALLCSGACAMEMANPWVEVSPEKMLETIGLSFYAPEGAEVIAYRMLVSESLAEMQFVFEGAECTARIRPAAEFEDISGMYYDWEHVEGCEIQWCFGEIRYASKAGQQIELCLWYDMAPGLMYSVSAIAAEGECPDIFDLANVLFVPAQGDVDSTPADVLAQALADCTGYMGTAGSSLKEAIAATGLLAFAVEHGAADAEDLAQTVQSAIAALDEAQLQELAFCMEGIGGLIDSAFAGFDSVAGLFDDAGVGETAQSLIQAENAQAHWNALMESIRSALNM